MDSSDNSKKGFFKHVFNFDNDSKSDILNIIQYTLLAIIPVIILNKGMQKYVPEADEKKGSVEILAEVLIQIIIMFIGLLMIHRIVTYLPTYSGMEYPEFNIIFIILAILMITLSLQTKLGEKVSILVDRLTELWEGPQSNNKGKNGKGKGNPNVKVSQPISGQNMGGSITMPINTLPSNQSAMNQSLYGGSTSISQLPNDSSNQSYSQSSQQLPNYNNMYQQDTTPLIGAATPGMDSFEPMAANSVLGGGFGASW